MKEILDAIQDANRKLEIIQRVKCDLETELARKLGHNIEGSKTYHADGYKVTLTTGYNYSLDKEKYKELNHLLPENLNPVSEKITYEVSQKMVKDAEKFADQKIMGILAEILSKKPKKLYVKLEEESSK